MEVQNKSRSLLGSDGAYIRVFADQYRIKRQIFVEMVMLLKMGKYLFIDFKS